MRTVTVDAFVLNRLVYEFLPFKRLCLVYVAGEAYFVAGSVQHPGIIRLVRIMAHGTSPDRHRPMDKFSGGEFLVMAHKAEIHAFSAKLKSVRGLMRVMTLRTFPLFDGFMHRLLRIKPVVAFIAKVPNISYGSELVLTFLFVAGGTIPYRGRAVDKLLLAHPAVAFIGNAGLLCTGISSI